MTSGEPTEPERRMIDYPPDLPTVGLTAPVPRRIRGVLGGRTVLDTTAAMYVWEWTHYPAYYLPLADLDAASVPHRPADASLGLDGYVRIEWDALDAWYEEDEQVFVHPRDPYTRVDAIRSTRRVRVEIDGVVLAESASPVLVFETGLPTRYYVNRTEVDFGHLRPTGTRTPCPYKGVTSCYWSAHVGGGVHPDIAWTYDYPTRQLLPIAGLIAFYNEKVDIVLDGERLERPVTHFS